MRPTPTTEWVAEDDLATELNIPREVLQAAREKMGEQPTDVDYDGPWIVWKKTAATQFAASLGLVWPSPEKAEPAIEELTVHSAPRVGGHHYPNPRMLTARRANGELVYVQVPDSSKFSTYLRTGEPMTFKAQPSAIGAHWVLVGRAPREKGAW